MSTDLTVPARDGCVLAATLTRPAGRGPWPAVVVRTPYDRGRLAGEAHGWAARGFACLVLDVRGRYGSAGRFRPYTHEEDDGADVLDHVRAAGWCDGRVLLAGASYGAHCAVRTALARPGEVAGVLVAVPALGAGETVREPGGAARLACRAGWWAEHGGRRRSAPARPVDPTALPLPDLLRPRPPGWTALWRAPRRDPALWPRLASARPPLLAVGGTADPFAADTRELARAWGGPSRLLLGPWGHGLDAPHPGRALAGRRVGEVYARWARAVLDGGAGTGHRGLLAVDADGGWRDPRPHRRRIELRLADAAFTADPADPFPSTPGGDHPGRALLETAAPVRGELHGSVGVELDVTSDAPDADWFARLWWATPTRRGVIGTAVRRTAPRGPVRLRTPPVGLVLPPDARLVVEVAGHHFPAHARNPHTGTDHATARTLRPDRRSVRAAALLLPLAAPAAGTVPASAVPASVIEETAA